MSMFVNAFAYMKLAELFDISFVFMLRCAVCVFPS